MRGTRRASSVGWRQAHRVVALPQEEPYNVRRARQGAEKVTKATLSTGMEGSAEAAVGRRAGASSSAMQAEGTKGTPDQ